MFSEWATLLRATKNDHSSIGRLITELQPHAFAADNRKAVTAALLSGLLRELLDWQETYEDEVEKAYGIPWAEQFKRIQQQVFRPWADTLESLEGADDQQAFRLLVKLVHHARSYGQIRPSRNPV